MASEFSKRGVVTSILFAVGRDLAEICRLSHERDLFVAIHLPARYLGKSDRKFWLNGSRPIFHVQTCKKAFQLSLHLNLGHFEASGINVPT